MQKTLYTTIFLIVSLCAQAQNNRVSVRDIGVIGLFSHDIFTWDHKKKVNTENGVLDLSTIFDYEDGNDWDEGGNPKNSENAPVYTFTMELVEFYLSQLDFHDPIQARKNTIQYFIEQVLISYENLTGERFFFEANTEPANNVEQAVLRGMHDILPGRIHLYRDGEIKDYKLTKYWTRKTRLNRWEMMQEIRNFDGDYDPEYTKIDIIIRKINLKKIDAEFIRTYSDFTQEQMLEELKGFGAGETRFSDLSFSHHLRELVAKSICSGKSEWLPKNNCN